MARTSRKIMEINKNLPAERIFNTAVYVRLSVEDGDVIENQQSLTESFVKSRRDMRLMGVYCDNGFSGTNFCRPQFLRMMSDITGGKINCVVVKDLSRFGRDYIETGYYLERIFPDLGVRFVAVNDNYDTAKNSENDVMVGAVKNIVNGFIAKDISNKVSAVMRQKQENGEFIGSFAPYGYMKNPDRKNHLIIDPVTAPIVREIFELRLSGIGVSAIARTLDERGIPSPLLYNFLSGRYEIKNKPSGIWSGAMVKKITENFTYTGNLTQRKRVKSLFNGVRSTDLDKSQFVTVRNTHEKIVSEEMFNRSFRRANL